MKKTKIFRSFMTLITVFSLSVAIAYSLKDRNIPIPGKAVYSDTLYNTLKGEATAVSALDTVGNFDSGVNFSEVISEDIPQISTTVNSTEEEITTAENVPEVMTSESTAEEDLAKITVLNHKSGIVSDMPLEEYVACVVAAEMPSDSPAEAFKAQAVAVRTLAVKYIKDTKKPEHKGADICTDSGHCQSFVSRDELISKYGDIGNDLYSRVENTVRATKGLILLYENQPIVAVFHASSGSATASSHEIWGGSLDYLVSVETDELYDESLKNQVISNVSFTKDEFISKFTSRGFTEILQYKESPFHTFISAKELTESGRVASLNIAGRSFSGKELRTILGLRSSDFDIGFSENKITFTTKGYGHGVGMSQLGAVAMANKGESFYSILAKYYPDTIIGII